MTSKEAIKALGEMEKKVESIMPKGASIACSIGIEVDDGRVATANIQLGRPIIIMECFNSLQESVSNSATKWIEEACAKANMEKSHENK